MVHNIPTTGCTHCKHSRYGRPLFSYGATAVIDGWVTARDFQRCLFITQSGSGWVESQLLAVCRGWGGHRSEIWLRLTERTPAVTTASLWMAKSWAGSWNGHSRPPSTLLASCYTSPQGVSGFDAAQETRWCCRKRAVWVPSAAHWSLG